MDLSKNKSGKISLGGSARDWARFVISIVESTEKERAALITTLASLDKTSASIVVSSKTPDVEIDTMFPILSQISGEKDTQ